jgi:replicative DNA helicase
MTLRPYEVSTARWGIDDLDRITGGLEDGGWLVVLGDTNAGKSSLVRQMALSTALTIWEEHLEGKVVIFTLEEKAARWCVRSMAWLGGFNNRQLKNKARYDRYCAEKAGREDSIWGAGTVLAQLPIMLGDGRHTMAQIEAYCKDIARREPVAMVVIDWLQMIELPSDNRTEEYHLRSLAHRMLSLRDDLGCPIITPSQVTEDSRTGTRTAKAAKALEQMADTTIDILRPRDPDTMQWSPTASLVCKKAREMDGFGKFVVHTDFQTGRWAAVTDREDGQARRGA